jgi:hypothetical protein
MPAIHAERPPRGEDTTTNAARTSTTLGFRHIRARGMIATVITNGLRRFHGIFTITDGDIRTADIGGPGLGIPDDMLPR